MAEELIAGLDIGSSEIRVATGTLITGSDGSEHLQIMGAVSLPSEGVYRGSVSSIEDVVSSLSKTLERAERLTGHAVNKVWASIAGQQILVQESRGVIGVARSDGEIREEDVERAIEAARTVATPLNYEILHVIPKSYTIDGQRGIKDPVGMNGIRLEVDAVIIQAMTSHIKNLTKSVYRTGLDINDLVYTPLATAEAVLTSKQKDLGVCVADIGATTTNVLVFEEGDILHTAVIPIGGDHITNDIAIGLRTSLDVAERAKHAIGHAVPNEIDPQTSFNLTDFGSEEDEAYKVRFVSEIIEARVEELMEAIDEELKRVDRSGMLPVGIVLSGGTLKLSGMVDVAKRKLRLPASIGLPTGVSSVIDEIHDPAFSTVIGLVVWGYDMQAGSRKKFTIQMKGAKDLFSSAVKSIKKLMP
jgi:cell division protein FtsA